MNAPFFDGLQGFIPFASVLGAFFGMIFLYRALASAMIERILIDMDRSAAEFRDWMHASHPGDHVAVAVHGEMLTVIRFLERNSIISHRNLNITSFCDAPIRANNLFKLLYEIDDDEVRDHVMSIFDTFCDHGERAFKWFQPGLITSFYTVKLLRRRTAGFQGTFGLATRFHDLVSMSTRNIPIEEKAE